MAGGKLRIEKLIEKPAESSTQETYVLASGQSYIGLTFIPLWAFNIHAHTHIHTLNLLEIILKIHNFPLESWQKKIKINEFLKGSGKSPLHRVCSVYREEASTKTDLKVK